MTVVLGVESVGEAPCPGNPPTPYTLDLGEPLGDRELLDGTVRPARPLHTEQAAAEPDGR